MSRIVFKLRCSSPNLKNTAKNNKYYLRYIVTRPGSITNENVPHGAFGYINFFDNIKEANLEDMERYVQDISSKGINIYKGIISMVEQDAQYLGYISKEKWEQLLKQKIPYIAEKINIEYKNLEWLASFHKEKNHPHVHIMFWDKAQQIKSPFIKPQVLNEIRRDLIKHVFKEDLEKLYEIKDKGRDSISKSEIFNELKEATKKINKELISIPIMEQKLSNAKIQNIVVDILKLKEIIPKEGRLNYKFMPLEVKEEIGKISYKILDISKECKNSFHQYVDTKVEIQKYYTKNEAELTKAKELAKQEILNKMGNLILKMTKELELEKEARNINVTRVLIEDVFSILTRDTEHIKARLQDELSKEAKKEKVLEITDTSIFKWG